MNLWLMVIMLHFTAREMCTCVCLQLRENCAAQPCQNNATCISVPTGYLDVVHIF